MESSSNNQDVILCRENYAKWKNPKTKLCKNVEKFTWTTKNRMEVSLITFGARLISIKLPDRNGECKDVLHGYDNFEDYAKDGKFHFGATIGPVAGIIKNSEYCMNGRYHKVPRNYKNKHCMNSGKNGLQRVNWMSHIDGTDVILSHATDGTNGFPAIILIQIIFSVSSKNHLTIKMTARSNKVTPIDLSQQLYINLASHDGGDNELKDHLISINSSKFRRKDDEGIFKKSFEKIETDLRNLTEVRQLIDNESKSLDCLYEIDNDELIESIPMVMQAIHPSSGRIIEIFSNQPALYLSLCPEFPVRESEEDEKADQKSSTENLTLEYLRTKLTEKEIEFFKCRADTEAVDLKPREVSIVDECPTIPVSEEVDKEIIGKDGTKYFQNCGFSISCHNFPNAVNHQNRYPEILLKPGSVYENVTILKFKVHVLISPAD
ncbi:galactose mutarotase-like [Chironomus tepperi]|uniref:galactose mutarotase-like n=1 Tax=Chironomus tepperi TaxID=113505 RepID=UPI00391F9B3E